MPFTAWKAVAAVVIVAAVQWVLIVIGEKGR